MKSKVLKNGNYVRVFEFNYTIENIEELAKLYLSYNRLISRTARSGLLRIWNEPSRNWEFVVEIVEDIDRIYAGSRPRAALAKSDSWCYVSKGEPRKTPEDMKKIAQSKKKAAETFRKKAIAAIRSVFRNA